MTRGRFPDSIRPGVARLLRPGAPLGGLARRLQKGYRRVAAQLGAGAAEVVFHAGYAPPDSAIVDCRRAAKILDHLFDEGWLAASSVVVPAALELAALRRVHDDDYLASLDTPAAVARALGGLEPPPPSVAAAYLAAQRWATAGTVEATRRALARSGVVVNLGGGFHHAERARGGGFCLFHDVAVALAEARAKGFGGRVLVLDLDLHQGDGTRRLLASDEAAVAASIHATAWDEDEVAGAIDVALGSGVGDTTYLAAVREVLERAFAAGEPDLVFYVAGVDVAIDDTLGSWRVSADAIAERDRLVLERCKERPVVMVLAGGYGTEAWRHSARTLVWLLSGRDVPIPAATDVALRRFRRVARGFGEAELAASGPGAAKVASEDNFGITEADLLGDLVHRQAKDHLLGFYTAYGLELALERYGLFELMRRRGYPRVRLELNLHAGSGEAVTVRSDDARRLVLLELVVSELREVVPHRLLNIEWLLLQDPQAQPTAERPLLPGQEHPGLGGLRLIIGMLAMAAERLGFDGIAFVPAYFHTAAQARGMLRFLDPGHEAVFVAIKEAMGARSLLDATRLMADGGLVDEATGEPAPWQPVRMVLPISERLRAVVTGPDYDRAVELAVPRIRLKVSGKAIAGEGAGSAAGSPPSSSPLRPRSGGG